MATRVAWLGLMLAQDPVGNSTDGVPLLRLGQMTRPGLRGMEGVTASDPGDCFTDLSADGPTYKHCDAHRKKCHHCQGLDAFFMDEGFKVPS